MAKLSSSDPKEAASAMQHLLKLHEAVMDPIGYPGNDAARAKAEYAGHLLSCVNLLKSQPVEGQEGLAWSQGEQTSFMEAAKTYGVIPPGPATSTPTN